MRPDCFLLILALVSGAFMRGVARTDRIEAAKIMKIDRLRIRVLAAFLCGVLGLEGCATHGEDHGWPDKVVSSDRLRFAAPPSQLTMPRRNLNESMPNGTAVLRLHVDERGTVRKTALVTSSGSAVLDGAAQRAMGGARFVPYREAGEALPVTTLMPISVKGSAQCRGFRPLDC